MECRNSHDTREEPEGLDVLVARVAVVPHFSFHQLLDSFAGQLGTHLTL